jgi:CrcB protein
MPTSLAVALGGALGSLGRYGVDRLIERRSVSVFPWATFVINISGCLLIGAAVTALVDHHHLPAWVRVGIIVGFLGGYTTFSTFGREALDLVEEREMILAVAYGAGSVALGVVAVLLGASIGRHL